MSSFSSVVKKGGQQFKPKPIARRNAPRKVTGNSEIHKSNESVNTTRDNTPEITEPVQEVEQDVPVQSTSPVHATTSVNNTANLHEVVATEPLQRIRTSPRNSQHKQRTSNDVQNTTNQQSHKELRSPVLRGVKRKALPQVEVLDQRVSPERLSAEDQHEPQSDNASAAAPMIVDEAQVSPTVSTTTRKKQRRSTKATPDVVSSEAQAQPTTTSVRDSSVESQSVTDLFKSATDRAASVSSLANEISEQSLSQISRAEQHASNEHNAANDAQGQDNASTAKPKQSGRKKRKKTVQEQAAEIVANAMGEDDMSPRKRGLTPEDAETHELDPNEVTMGNLCKDSKLGKKSNLEKEMQANWSEILERRREDREKAIVAAQSRRRKAFGKPGLAAPLPETVAAAPTMMVVNGKIVVGAESREIDRSAQLAQAAVLDENNVREDKDYYKRVNQSTVGMKASYGKKFRWDDETTERFYKGLRMFGTDFMMIANMFPGIDRKQIKMKFIREENADKARVMSHLQNREEIDLEEYSQIADIQLQDVKAVEDDIKAEEKRLRDEDNERRKNAGLKTNTNDGTNNIPIPSTEDGDATEYGGGDNTAAQNTETSNRYASLAADIMAPSTKRQRKTNAQSKKRGPKAGRIPAGGVEELLGSADEVRV